MASYLLLRGGGRLALKGGGLLLLREPVTLYAVPFSVSPPMRRFRDCAPARVLSITPPRRTFEGGRT